MSNREGRINLWTVAADGGTPERLTKGRDGRLSTCMVARREVDRLRIGRSVALPGRGLQSQRDSRRWRPVDPADRRLHVRHEAVLVAPTGRSCLSGERSGILNVWRVSFREGRRAGPSTRVTLGQGQDTDTAVSRDGRILAFSALRKRAEHLGDPARWRRAARGHPRRVPRLSAALTRRKDAPGPIQSNRKARRLDGGPERTLPLAALSVAGHPAAGALVPDGKRIAYVREGKLFIQPVGSLSGLDTGLRSGAIEWSPDGRRIVLGTRRGSRRDPHLRRGDPDGEAGDLVASGRRLSDVVSRREPDRVPAPAWQRPGDLGRAVGRGRRPGR